MELDSSFPIDSEVVKSIHVRLWEKHSAKTVGICEARTLLASQYRVNLIRSLDTNFEFFISVCTKIPWTGGTFAVLHRISQRKKILSSSFVLTSETAQTKRAKCSYFELEVSDGTKTMWAVVHRRRDSGALYRHMCRGTSLVHKP